jgi:hypothetical protein
MEKETMKTLLSVAICLGLMAFVPTVWADTIVLPFEDLSGSGGIPTDYADIRWTGGWNHMDYTQWPYTPHSGTQRVYYQHNPCELDFLEGPVRFDGAWFSGFGPEFSDSQYTVQFYLYYESNLVHSSDTIAPGPEPVFLAAGYGGPVDLVVVNSPYASSWSMDDVTYGTVPEPATLTLLSMGALGMFGYFRRQRIK